MKKLALALAALWAAFFMVSAAHAQPFTRSQLTTNYLNPCIFANTTGLITEACVYTLHANEILSLGALADTNAWTGANSFTINPSFAGIAANALVVGNGSSPITSIGPITNGLAVWNSGSVSASTAIPNGVTATTQGGGGQVPADNQVATDNSILNTYTVPPVLGGTTPNTVNATVLNYTNYLKSANIVVRFDVSKNGAFDPTGTTDMGPIINSTISDAQAALGYTLVTQTGTAASGSTVVTGMANTTGIMAGMLANGLGVTPGTLVTVVSPTSVALSAQATSLAGTETLTFNTSFPSSSSTAAIAEVDVPCGDIKIATPIVLKSFVRLKGAGEGCTVFNTAVTAPVASNANHQLVFSGGSDFSIRCLALCTNTWNGMALFAVQASSFQRIEISGFSGAGANGIIVAPTNSLPAVDYTSGLIGTNGNFIFNNFEDIYENNDTVGVSLSGQIVSGACTGGTDPNGAIDTTDNFFPNLVMIGVQFGVTMKYCDDSNHFPEFQYYGITNGRCFLIGNDGSTGQHDNFQLYASGLCSALGSATNGSVTYIETNGSSTGHHINIHSDQTSALGTGNYASPCVKNDNSTTIQFSDLELPGICNSNIPTDNSGGVGAAILGGDNMYFAGSGVISSTAPAFYFYGDQNVGITHPGTGSMGLKGNVVLPSVGTGTPVASLCIDSGNNIIKKTTTGSCV